MLLQLTLAIEFLNVSVIFIKVAAKIISGIFCVYFKLDRQDMCRGWGMKTTTLYKNDNVNSRSAAQISSTYTIAHTNFLMYTCLVHKGLDFSQIFCCYSINIHSNMYF